MAKYMTKFASIANYNTNKSNLHYPHISTEPYNIHYDHSAYITQYLTFEAIESGTFSFTQNAIDYSIDNGSTWVTLPANQPTPIIDVGKKILWKAVSSNLTLGSAPYASSKAKIGTFKSTGKFNAYGNILSLGYGDNFLNYTVAPDSGYFGYLFNNSKIIDASKLELSIITNLYEQLFYYMFAGSSLKYAPELPINVTNSNRPFQGMFINCTSLIKPPSVVYPTYAAAQYVCTNMFAGCTSLKYGPKLPSTNIGNYWYQNMFNGCTSLTKAPDLPLPNSKTGGCYAMFKNCINLEIPPIMLITTCGNTGCKEMFYGCRKLKKSPILYSQALNTSSYESIFNGCTNLNHINMGALTLGTNSLVNWCNNVALTGVLVKDITATWELSGNTSLPNGWTTIYYDSTDGKYYLDTNKTTQCDEYGNTFN